jgi:hypothetical protein
MWRDRGCERRAVDIRREPLCAESACRREGPVLREAADARIEGGDLSNETARTDFITRLNDLCQGVDLQ